MVTYWHGSHERSAFGCECSLDKNESECDANHNPIGTETYCNCDSLDSTNIDIGILTNMDQLPVTQLNYGDSQDRISWIEYELGPLGECQTKKISTPGKIKNLVCKGKKRLPI